MKKLLLIVFLFSFAQSYATNWLNSIEDAQKIALATNKLIVVDFWASWCGPCKRMDKESWSDQEVSNLMSNFVAVKINISRDQQTASKYGVRSIPDVFIMNGNGDVIHHNIGYMSKSRLMSMLKEYALQTSFLQQESINYFKNKNYNTAYRLGKKYLDYSMYLKGAPKNNFLNLAEVYLNESLSLLDKRQKNYKMISQRIELLKLLPQVYDGNSEKVLRKIQEDFNEKEIASANKSLYYYLNLCCSKAEGKDEAPWLEKLSAEENHEVYLTKVDILFPETKA